MPTLSEFYGIKIAMNFGDTGVHNLPHFHAWYGEYKAVFDLDGNVLAGRMPVPQTKFIVAWAELHKDQLLECWALAISGEPVGKIDPLR